MEAGAEGLVFFNVLAHHATGLGAVEHVVAQCITCELGQFGRADAVTAHELRLYAQLLQLTQHGARHGIHAAVEDNIGLLALDVREDGHEVSGLVGGVLAAHDLAAGGLHALGELIGHTLAVGGAVINDGHRFSLELLDGIAAEGSAQLAVIGHHTEGCLEALQGVLGVGGRGRDLGDARIRVNLGGRDGGARVQVAHHAGHLGIDQLLRGGGALLGVCTVVLREQLELHGLAANLDVALVQVCDGQLGAGLVVLAEVRDATGHGCNMANLDGHGLCVGCAGK